MNPPHRSAPRVLRTVLVLMLVLIGGMTVGGTASAHTALSSSDPADGAVLTAPPAAVTLVFDAPMVNIGATVLITGPGGQQYPTGTPVVDSTDVRTDIPALGPAGPYTVSYRAVSGDGHPVEGQIQFQLEPPVPVTTAPVHVSTPVPASAAPTPATVSEPSAALSSSAAPPVTGSQPAGAVSPTGHQPTTAAVATSGTSQSQDGISGWWWAAVVVVLLLVGAAGAVIIRQRRTRGQA